MEKKEKEKKEKEKKEKEKKEKEKKAVATKNAEEKEGDRASVDMEIEGEEGDKQEDVGLSVKRKASNTDIDSTSVADAAKKKKKKVKRGVSAERSERKSNGEEKQEEDGLSKEDTRYDPDVTDMSDEETDTEDEWTPVTGRNKRQKGVQKRQRGSSTSSTATRAASVPIKRTVDPFNNHSIKATVISISLAQSSRVLWPRSNFVRILHETEIDAVDQPSTPSRRTAGVEPLVVQVLLGNGHVSKTLPLCPGQDHLVVDLDEPQFTLHLSNKDRLVFALEAGEEWNNFRQTLVERAEMQDGLVSTKGVTRIATSLPSTTTAASSSTSSARSSSSKRGSKRIESDTSVHHMNVGKRIPGSPSLFFLERVEKLTSAQLAPIPPKNMRISLYSVDVEIETNDGPEVITNKIKTDNPFFLLPPSEEPLSLTSLSVSLHLAVWAMSGIYDADDGPSTTLNVAGSVIRRVIAELHIHHTASPNRDHQHKVIVERFAGGVDPDSDLSNLQVVDGPEGTSHLPHPTVLLRRFFLKGVLPSDDDLNASSPSPVQMGVIAWSLFRYLSVSFHINGDEVLTRKELPSEVSLFRSMCVECSGECYDTCSGCSAPVHYNCSKGSKDDDSIRLCDSCMNMKIDLAGSVATALCGALYTQWLDTRDIALKELNQKREEMESLAEAIEDIADELDLDYESGHDLLKVCNVHMNENQSMVPLVRLLSPILTHTGSESLSKSSRSSKNRRGTSDIVALQDIIMFSNSEKAKSSVHTYSAVAAIAFNGLVQARLFSGEASEIPTSSACDECKIFCFHFLFFLFFIC